VVVAATGTWLYALRAQPTPPIEHAHHASSAQPHVAVLAARGAPGTVTISGVVYDDRPAPVPNVDVIARANGHEVRATTDAKGAWIAAVAPGSYRLFVRGDGVLSVGEADRRRIDSDPFARDPKVPDEGLMPVLAVTGDTANIELSVVRIATFTGTVVNNDDDSDTPLADVAVHARPAGTATGLVPVLGTDLARTNAEGTYVLHVPAGSYLLEAAHRHFGTIARTTPTEIEVGRTVEDSIYLSRGCQIEGHVVDADGHPANDGALELGDAESGGFEPGGPIGGDGAFRFTTFADGPIRLRAWPWRSGPSAPRTFACDNGATFRNVVFTLPRDVEPDIEGVVVDAAGRPVPLAYLDVTPLDTSAPHQTERASSNGTFRVFDAPAGRYVLTVDAPGRGVGSTTTTSPTRDARLSLGGTGRIAGTVTGIANGSFEVAFESCADVVDASLRPVRVAHEPQIVRVIGGRFTIDGAPACKLALTARWRGTEKPIEVVVTAKETSAVELELGTPTEKLVHGIVRDGARAPVENARVTARLGDRVIDTVATDADGHYAVHAVAGAELTASANSHTERATVGLANVADEQLDISLSSK
jgi:hypothetical protein